ncbi:prolyl oligopeptidase family serine peptidase [bacterium]|nr:prolyl oligopeptidase family serine peptidase [bacterium]
MKKISLLLIIAVSITTLQAQEPEVIRRCLAIGLPGTSGRSVWGIDAVESRYLLGETAPPVAGDAVRYAGNDEERWQLLEADSSGWFTGDQIRNGYTHMILDEDREKVIILEAMGAQRLFVNGTPRIGSKYGVKDSYESWEPRFDYTQIPVRLQKGKNHLFCRCTRGRFKLRIREPEQEVFFNLNDLTIPDILAGETDTVYAAAVVVNSSDRILDRLEVRTDGQGVSDCRMKTGSIQPRSVRKIRFGMVPCAIDAPEKMDVRIVLYNKGKQIASAETVLEIKNPGQNHKRTFISSIDGSVQYYAVNPAAIRDDASAPALILSVHGAGVEATNQAGAYGQKTWATLVAATNRRAFGYDWEDWGRLDALEVLADVQSRYRIDPDRVYLTGHSMGGHGTWQLGVLYPDRWGAIRPSAGWISFSSYAPRQSEADEHPVEALINRAGLASNTLAMKDNYRQHGIYIIHGDKDESVPVSQAREMVSQLQGFHHDWQYHEEPGAGHWWDNSPEPGAACVDWPPMLDFFARHARIQTEQARQVDFTTPCPGVSADCHWVTIRTQIEPLLPSRVSISVDPHLRRYSGTTDNVSVLGLDLSPLFSGDTVRVELDSTAAVSCVPAGRQRIWLGKNRAGWNEIEEPPPTLKGPHRSGLFKDAFTSHVVLVYGTKGSEEENRWAFSKARFDGECWWYQGNGSVDILADRDFHAKDYPDRNIVLYGNASTNSAWQQLLLDDPVQVAKGRLRAGSHVLVSDSLACFMIRPRRDSETASVGIVGGTGIAGMRLTDTRPYLFAGYALPDLTVLGPGIMRDETGGLVGAGFFGNDWSVESGVFQWADQKQ